MRCDPLVFVPFPRSHSKRYSILAACTMLHQFRRTCNSDRCGEGEVGCSAFGARSSWSVALVLVLLLDQTGGGIVHYFPNQSPHGLAPGASFKSRALLTAVQRTDGPMGGPPARGESDAVARLCVSGVLFVLACFNAIGTGQIFFFACMF
jgi:hypothetical protein